METDKEKRFDHLKSLSSSNEAEKYIEIYLKTKINETKEGKTYKWLQNLFFTLSCFSQK